MTLTSQKPCRHNNNNNINSKFDCHILKKLDFSLTVKAATLIFISGRGSAISSANEGKSGFIYHLVNS